MKNLYITLAAISFCLNTQAALNINFAQEGANTVITASGDLDISGIPFTLDFGGNSSYISSSGGFENVWSNVTTGADYYQLPFTIDLFPQNFAQNNGIPNGQTFGIFGSPAESYIYVADGFTSGTINGSLTLLNTDLSTLGLQTMDLSTWGPGLGQGLEITANPIPEPFPILLATCLNLAIFCRRPGFKAPFNH